MSVWKFLRVKHVWTSADIEQRQGFARPAFAADLSTITGGRTLGAARGHLVLAASHALVGARGVSGGSSEQDDVCAPEGLDALSLVRY